jgi:prepilin-type N-terminal cleavage/methylation domain-containing protein
LPQDVEKTFSRLAKAKIQMRNREGFGLIELMFCLAIMSVMMMGAVQMSIFQAKMQKSIELSINWLEINQSVFQTLINPASCTLALVGAPFLPSGTTTFPYHDQSGFLLANGIIFQGLQVNRVEIKSGAAIGPTQYFATVYLQLQKLGSFNGPAIVQHSFNVKLDISGANVVDCF